MVARRAGEEHPVPRPDRRGREARILQHAHAGGVEIKPVAPAALDHLGVAGDDLHPRGPGGFAQGLNHARERLEGQTLLDDERAAEVFRLSAAHGQVVDRAADGELADVATREKERRDNEAVGGENELLGSLQHRAVAELAQGGIVQRGQDQLFDEARGLLPPAAVIQGNDIFHGIHPEHEIQLRIPNS